MIRQLRYFLLAGLILITACSFTQAQSVQLQPTATTVRVVPVTPVPTVNRQPHTVPTTPPQPSPTPGAIQCDAAAPERISHTVTVNLNYGERRLSGEQVVQYINWTNDPLAQLVFNIEPNRWPNAFTLETVTVGDNGLEAGYELTGRRLTVDLPETLQPGCWLRLRLTFTIQIPPVGDGEDGYQGYFGYTVRQVNLGHWLPTTAVRLNHEWVTHDAVPIGEVDVLESVDWDITLTVTNAPRAVQVAAPGEMLESGPDRWHFTLANARDFPMSMSDQFMFISAETESGVTVELYSFDDALIPASGGVIDSAAYALDVSTKAVQLYSDLFGAYPYQRMIVVEGDFPDGMEFTGLVFVGGGYFRNFGGPTSYLMMISVHEVSHQWWYARVGSDQALYPWLDEALATYSEYAFVEEYYPGLKDWWWDFRVDSLAPEGYVDDSVYDFKSRRAYINAVYLRGVRMLRDLRADLGTDGFFDWLRRYADGGAGRIVSPDYFWSLLTPEQFALTESTRNHYLRQPQVTGITGGS